MFRLESSVAVHHKHGKTTLKHKKSFNINVHIVSPLIWRQREMTMFISSKVISHGAFFNHGRGPFLFYPPSLRSRHEIRHVSHGDNYVYNILQQQIRETGPCSRFGGKLGLNFRFRFKQQQHHRHILTSNGSFQENETHKVGSSSGSTAILPLLALKHFLHAYLVREQQHTSVCSNRRGSTNTTVRCQCMMTASSRLDPNQRLMTASEDPKSTRKRHEVIMNANEATPSTNVSMEQHTMTQWPQFAPDTSAHVINGLGEEL